jgi:DNA-binding GntR family transcriptional regulator
MNPPAHSGNKSRQPPPPSGVANAVAAGIVEFICRADLPVGQRLTEQALADELGVSRSPIRKALQYLESVGAVGSSPNKGFFLNQAVSELRRFAVPVDVDSDENMYLKVADDRLYGKLPEEVSEADLMERYELTRLQVQRILNRMGREGLVDRKPGRGWVFRPFLNSDTTYREGYRFRMIIEPAALLEPTFRIDKTSFARARREQKAMLDGGIEKWPRTELFRVGAEFHEVLVAAANNSFLLDALRNVNQLRRLLEYRANLDRSRLYRQCEEHLMLLDLVEGGDRMEASYKMRQHLDVARSLKLHEDGVTGSSAEGTPSVVEVHV